MAIFLFFLFVVISSLTQVTFLPALEVSGMVPNLLLIIVLGWVMLDEYKVAAWWALIGGLLVDLFSGLIFGLFALNLILVILINYYLFRGYYSRSTWYIRAGGIALSTVIFAILSHLFSWLAKIINLNDFALGWSWSYWQALGLEIIINVLIGLVMYRLISLVHEFLDRKRLGQEMSPS